MAGEVTKQDQALTRGAQMVSSARGDLEQQLSSLRGKLSSIGAQWRGSGSTAFQRVMVQWDEQALGITAKNVERLLMDGEPRIAVGRAQPQGIELTVFMNEAGDEKTAVKRLREIFKA